MDKGKNIKKLSMSYILIEAVRIGDYLKIKQLIHNNINILTPSSFDSVLMLSTVLGHIAVLQLMLSEYRDKIDVNCKDESNNYNTPLILAILHNRRDVFILLMSQHDIDINYVNKNGNSALTVATQWNNIEFVNMLLDHQNIDINAFDNSNFPALWIACVKKHLEIVRLLIDSHADIDYQHSITGNTITIMAVLDNDLVNLKYFLSSNANLSIVNNKGESALLIACAKNHFEAAVMILEKYSFISDSDLKGNTALFYAAQNGNLELVNLLIESYGADYNCLTYESVSILMIACKHNHEQVVKYLLYLNNPTVKLHVSDVFGDTALSLLCATGNIALVKFYLTNESTRSKSISFNRFNSSVNFKTDKYFSHFPIHVAIANGFVDITELLIEYNADLYCLNYLQESCLYIACKFGFIKILELLIYRDIDVNTIIKNNKTCLMLIEEGKGKLDSTDSFVRNYQLMVAILRRPTQYRAKYIMRNIMKCTNIVVSSFNEFLAVYKDDIGHTCYFDPINTIAYNQNRNISRNSNELFIWNKECVVRCLHHLQNIYLGHETMSINCYFNPS